MRKNRIIVGIFTPALMGAILILGILSLNEFIKIPSDMLTFREVLGLIKLAYIFVGIQSIIYSLLMEFIINPYIKNNLLVVFISVLLGGLSGIIPPFMIIGGGVGLALGLILRRMYLTEQNKIKN